MTQVAAEVVAFARPTIDASADLRVAIPKRTKGWQGQYVLGLVAGDALVCGLASGAVALTAPADHLSRAGTSLLWFAVPIWLVLLHLGRAYDRGLVGVDSDEFRRVVRAGGRGLALVAVVGFGLKVPFPRSLVAYVLPLAVLGSMAQRVIAHRVLRRARSVGHAQHGVVVVGMPQSALALVERLRDMPGKAFAIAGVCTNENLTVERVVATIRETDADTVAIASDSGLTTEELRLLGWELEGFEVDMIVSTDLIEVAGPRIHVRPIAGLPLLNVDRPELTGMRRAVKGAQDRVLALVALVLLAPFLMLILAAIRISSPGPAIFRQRRVGQHGREFTVLKLRTMREGAHAELIDLVCLNESDGPLFKIRDDPRVTRLGAVLRRYSIDELPQLWNVVRGHMSLVGPRPPLASEVATYGPSVHRRLLVKPGLTGLWQVSGRSDLDWEQSVRLDLSYVENWTPLLDLQILARTALAVLGRNGAY